MQNLISQLQISTYNLIVLHFLRRMFRKMSAVRIKSLKLSPVKGRMPTNLERAFGFRITDIDWDEFYHKIVIFYRFGNIVHAIEIYVKSCVDMARVTSLLVKMYPDHKQHIFRYSARLDLPNRYKTGRLVPSDNYIRTILDPGFYPEPTNILKEIDDNLPGITVEVKELTICRLSDTTSH